MLGIKGFDKNLCIKGVQFKVGETYKYGNWENERYDNMVYAVFGLFDDLQYLSKFYPFNGLNKYCIVETNGEVVKDSKEYRIVKEFTIVKILTLEELFAHFICEKHQAFNDIFVYKTDVTNSSGCTVHGNFSTGVSKEARVVLRGKGYKTTMLNLGSSSITKTYGTSSMAINRGNCSSACAMGNKSVAYVDGNDSTATCIGENSIAIADGEHPIARGIKGSVLILIERNVSGQIINHVSVYVDGVNIKEHTFYGLSNGHIIPTKPFVNDCVKTKNNNYCKLWKGKLIEE